MSKIQKTVIGIVLILLGVMSLLESIGLVSINYENNFYYLLQFIGLVMVFSAAERTKRTSIFVGSILFISGMVFFIVDHYEILNPVKIVIPSILISFGAGFLLLFIDNVKEKVFLILSVILFAITLLFIVLHDNYVSLDVANRMVYQMLEFWPVLLSLIGIGLLANSRIK